MNYIIINCIIEALLNIILLGFIISLVITIDNKKMTRIQKKEEPENMLVKSKNIVIKLKNKKISPAEEWTYPYKISEDTSRCNTHPDNLRSILLKE